MSDEKPARAPKPPKLCPKGHAAKTKFGSFACSSTRCGEDMSATYGSTELDLDVLAAKPTAEVAFEHRKQLAKMPEDLKGNEALKWAQEKMVDLLPEAVANIAFDLRYGTDKQREAATDRVLRANGMDKRDAGASMGGQGLIVLQLGSDSEPIPWLQRMQPAKVGSGEGEK